MYAFTSNINDDWCSESKRQKRADNRPLTGRFDPETEREEAKKHMENLNIQLPWPGWRAVKYLGSGQFGSVYGQIRIHINA